MSVIPYMAWWWCQEWSPLPHGLIAKGTMDEGPKVRSRGPESPPDFSWKYIKQHNPSHVTLDSYNMLTSNKPSRKTQRAEINMYWFCLSFEIDHAHIGNTFRSEDSFSSTENMCCRSWRWNIFEHDGMAMVFVKKPLWSMVFQWFCLLVVFFSIVTVYLVFWLWMTEMG